MTCSAWYSVVVATERCCVQDASIKEINAAPWTKDVLVTAEKRVNGKQLLGGAPLLFMCANGPPLNGLMCTVSRPLI